MQSPSFILRGLCLLSVAGVSFPAYSVALPSKGGFIEQVNAHFAEWDLDQDAVLSVNEVELALTNPKIKGPEAAATAALRRGMRGKGIKSLTLAQIAASMPFDAKRTPVPPKYNVMYEAALKKINTTERALFPEGAPDASKLAQGRLGDCFLLAPFGTYVFQNPEGLKKMMEVQPDGQVSVTFASGLRVVMPPPTDGEIVVGASTRNHGTWANMFEKAVGQVFLTNQKTQRHVSPYSIIGVGGSPHTVLQMLTGHKSVRVGCEGFRKPGLDAATRETMLADLRKTLFKAQDEKKMIVCGNGAIGKQAIVPGIYYLHSYGVLGYDPQTDMVAFWNPMSNGHKPKGEPGLKYGYSTSYGRFSAPLTEVVQWLGSFSIESDTPVEG